MSFVGSCKLHEHTSDQLHNTQKKKRKKEQKQKQRGNSKGDLFLRKRTLVLLLQGDSAMALRAVRQAAVLLSLAVGAQAACSDLTDKAGCGEDSTCLWSPIWSPNLCTENPCAQMVNGEQCSVVSVDMPAPGCSAPPSDPDFCKVEVCTYNPTLRPSCHVRECLQFSESPCNSEPSSNGGMCHWGAKGDVSGDAPSRQVLHCTEDYCKGTSQKDCDGKKGCAWSSGDCTTTSCGEHSDELLCKQDTRCTWEFFGEMMARCTETECGKLSLSQCPGSDKCMVYSKDNTCVPKTCNKYNQPMPDRCLCAKDSDCVWHDSSSDPYCADKNFNTCPDLDVAFILDGSGSMQRSFGRHNHGFYGLMEILRDWVKTVPLTGDDHTMGANIDSKGKGFRMTFIQFSKADARPDEDHPMGCKVGECTDGLLSGNRAELNGDIDWHEANYQSEWTYLHDAMQDVADHTFLPSQSPDWRKHVVILIADGGITDIDGDACCQTSCGDPNCIDRNWKTSYPGQLADAEKKLASEDVQVFGIVMRRFTQHTFQDDNAETKLMPLVSEPKADHFMNLMLDEIAGQVLNKLCDKTSKFGKGLTTSNGNGNGNSGGSSACTVKTDKDECMGAAGCLWDSAMAECGESVCFPLCTEKECSANDKCTWSGDRCDPKPPQCAGKSQDDCEADDTCLWDVVWGKTTCVVNPCRDYNGKQDSCEGHIEVLGGADCTSSAADPDYCNLQTCAYVPGSKTCEVKKCLEDGKGRCETKTDCEWVPPAGSLPSGPPSVLVGFCDVKKCVYDKQTDCDKDTSCKWDGKACGLTECAKNKNEKDCDRNKKCTYNVATDPQVCVMTECATKYTKQGTCDADDKCMWDAADVCVPKTCEKHDDKCACDKDSDCLWSHSQSGGYCAGTSFNTCPDLDVAFILDGSGSMQRSFGRHNHGFYGLMEILRDWMKTVPLTGDDHTMGANIDSKGKGFRMTFIQFSKADARPDEDHPMGCKVGECTDGLLSGNRAELNGDIDWHEDNYQSQWTYLHDAMQDVADHTFLPSQSPAWREHVVILIADGGITDIDGDACCETRCGDRRCIDRKWKSSYPGQLDAAQEKLRSEDVQVFGIVMRRFQKHTFQDDNAEVKLMPLVSEPKADHFMNLMLDEIAGQVLNKLCDRDSLFGKTLGGVAPGCSRYVEENECAADTACAWDGSSSPACTESVCYPLCTEKECNAQSACAWNGKMCEYKPGCTAKDVDDCKKDDTCLWDVVWGKDTCVDNPCRDMKDEDTCDSVGVTMRSCVAPAGDPDFCKLDVCLFNAGAKTCEVKKCLEDGKGRCETKTDCQWVQPGGAGTTTPPTSTLVDYCAEKECQHTTQKVCDKDPLCKWDGKACGGTVCAKHKIEKDCDKDLSCHWDLNADPQVCKVTECAKYTDKSKCDADDKCMTAAGTDACVPKTCEKHTDHCDCTADADCKWHHGQSGASCVATSYDTCPDLDVAFILDGSGSMQRSFGRHNHGFYGLMEILRDWVKTVPLTGDDHTMGANIDSKGKGFRMTFIQFSKADARPDEDHPMGCKVGECTDGLLSGNRAELNGDIDWHEDNYQSQWTYLHDAMQDVADHTFLPSQSPAWREHVVILIADGGITDIDGDACCETRCGDRRCIDRRWKSSYPGQLDAAQQKLRSEDVMVLGVVIRRFQKHTFQDDNAEVKLMPVVTAPASDHFMNVMLDDVAGSVLLKLCDLGSKFGKAVGHTAGCLQYGNMQDCELDTGCAWDASAGQCADSVCFPHCDQDTCTKAGCTWAGKVCAPAKGCTDKDKAACEKDDTCLWDVIWGKDACVTDPCQDVKDKDTCLGTSATVPTPCTPPAGDPDYCVVDVCTFANDKTCTVKKCLQDTQTRCEDRTDCTWRPPVGTVPTAPPAVVVDFCTEDKCAHGTQQDCEKKDVCDWVGGKCTEDECAGLPDEKKCDKNPKCHMKTDGCAKTECAKKHTDKTPCDADDKCMWDATSSSCLPKTCSKHTQRCDCSNDADCKWHHASGQASYCTTPALDECDGLDVAFILDGSGSMRRRFGSHSHGFYAMIEMMRDWLKTVPLTGDDHKVGAAIAKNSPGLRITFIQFSKADARPDEDHPMGCKVGECTDGLLSGNRAELNGDLDWHEDNYQSQWTYLHDAMNDVADHTFLPSQSPAWRKHIVVIVADGGLTDYDGDACSKGCGKYADPKWKPRYKTSLLEGQAKLRDEDVTVLGVVIRRFKKHTFADENAEAKLKPLISDPRDAHFVNVELDNLKLDVLDRLCDKTSTFGKVLVGGAVAASCADLSSSGQSACEDDDACVWDAAKGACEGSMCYDLCTADKCATNPQCKWGTGDCVMLPPTDAPATGSPSTLAPPTPLPETAAPATRPPASLAPPTGAPPTDAPATDAPATPGPTPAPTPEPLVDECTVDGGKNAKVCAAAGGTPQTCVDADQKTPDTWTCVCPLPSTASALMKASPDCDYDECTLHSRTCTSVGQTCVDAAKTAPDSWKCECVPPATGTPGTMGAAVCKDPPGDCEEHGAICHGVGQACTTGGATKDAKVECTCIPPAVLKTGSVTAPNMPADCVLDECVAVCPTCARTAANGAHVCEEAEQTCEDMDVSYTSVRDWRCVCKAPLTGTQTMAVAVCELDECKAQCPTCADKPGGAGNVCEKAGQTCVERSLTTVSDWECHCVDPQVGTALTAVAVCEEDECRTKEQVCVSAGQACLDKDHHTAGTWQCVCPPPSNTSAVAAAAVCEDNECEDPVIAAVCEDAHQTCVDPDTTVHGNWECHCAAPGTGTAVRHAVAVCVLDECVVQCPTCADTGTGNVCTAAGQICEDPAPSHTNLGDWMCKCPAPSTKTAVATPVVPACTDGKDECVERSGAVQCQHLPRYTEDGCLCECGWDMGQGQGACTGGCCNPTKARADWCVVDALDLYNKDKPQCQQSGGAGAGGLEQFCMPSGQVPQDGGRPRRAPVAGVPNAQNNVCTDVQQRCVDPDMKTLDDWRCECVLPRTGQPGMQQVAVCEEDECVTHGAVCSTVGQKCVDAAKGQPDTWVCECTTGPAPHVSQQGGAAACVLDECVEVCPTCAVENSTNVCTEAGQICEDPVATSASLGDWMCKCVAPAVGTNLAAPVARCEVDECVVVCPTCAQKTAGGSHTCTAAGQTCEDPNKAASQTGNWRCLCAAPSHTTAVAAAARCETDECEGIVCTLGQICYDPDLEKKDDWRCECVSPTVGSATAGNATCEEDECKTHGEVCMNVGQQCTDADKHAHGTWLCECVAPDRGLPGVARAADCQPTEECKDNFVCSAAGQHCVDPSAAVGDWECHCIAPYNSATGAVMSLAVCTLDECVATCASCARAAPGSTPVCELHDQDCEDPDTSRLSDWVCKCRAPAVGTPGVGGAAVCELDECVATCGTCAGTVCSAAQQTCEDMSKDPKHVLDWVCKCALPSTASHTAAAVDVCMTDECADTTSPSVAACAAAGQDCVDPDPLVEGDWECRCPPPSTGTAVQAAAGTCMLNECAARCPTCADKGTGNACAAEGQVCVDPDHHTDGDWYCECSVGAGVSVGSAVVSCVLDECKVQCPTCADTGGGNLCATEGQTCLDVNTDARSTGDWECRCGAPFTDFAARGALAVCSVDECSEQYAGVVNGAVCADHGQLCHDSHVGSLHDFECVCPPPQHGTHTGAPVVQCTLDECTIHGAVCTAAAGTAQTCVDPDATLANDWECVCALPSTATQRAGVAVCTVDECNAHRQTCEGASPPQDCVDTDHLAPDTWECRCRTPAVGSAVGAAVGQCALDECEATCATCEKDVCRGAQQVCVDPNPSMNGLGDWECLCAPPSTMVAVANVADCPVDECVAHGHVCASVQQHCVDTAQGAASLGDWRCECVAPRKGSAIAAAASCEQDECREHGHVCTGHGQTCTDPDRSAGSLGDWECRCVAPATQKAVGASAACVHVGECEDHAVASVCESRGQTCEDPDVTVLLDWRCVCTQPSHGLPVTAGPAVCVLDECADACSTCAGDTCSRANQVCVDLDTSPVSGVNSWECRCTAPMSGTKVGAAAVCMVNECELHASTCTAAEQDCVDPDNSALGDWRCECRAPSVGRGTAAAAKCQTDECTFHEKTCAEKGQVCSDPDRSALSLGDWTCACVAPWGGTAVAGPAACVVDECTLYGHVCTAVGQTCSDEDLSLEGFWKCYCPPPNERVGRSKEPAACAVDECAVVGVATAVRMVNGVETNLCEEAGQTCEDPDTDALGDWTCTCAAPSNRTAHGHVARCEEDECADAAKAGVCAAASSGGVVQVCVDHDWDVTGDWRCECASPATGFMTAAAATCVMDECRTGAAGAACADEGQLCRDTDMSTVGTWECVCLHNSTATTALGPVSAAHCNEPASECKIETIRRVCTAARQGCYDPDVTRKNTWECECVTPARGVSVQGAPATCVLDECVETCPTCGGDVCASAGQTCTDPNTDAGSVGDWLCLCEGGSSKNAKGSAQGKPAVCLVDECAEVCDASGPCPSSVCAAGGTTCTDTNTDARSLGDWECLCRAPAAGRTTQGVPQCLVDECTVQGHDCGPGQTCADPNKLASSLGDWMCTCPMPSTGTAVASPAVCMENECSIGDNFHECEKHGQVCIDPVPTSPGKGDWECHCPQGSVFAVAAAATCTLDECTEQCLTCADNGGGNMCTRNGQTCTDPNTAPTSTRDWMCVCGSGAPSAVANVAVCQQDECMEVSNFGARTCHHLTTPRLSVDGCACECGWQVEAASLIGAAANVYGPGVSSKCLAGCCNPDHSAEGAWCVLSAGQTDPKCVAGARQQCPVASSSSGSAVAVSNLCTEAGQRCVDPDTRTASSGDWSCVCVSPASGPAKLGAATQCVVNECEAHGTVCLAAGQLCVDKNMVGTSGDWECVCPAPATGAQTAGVAVCSYVGECERADVSEVCTQVGQTCYDPNPALEGDWVCECVAPATGVSRHAAKATCVLDECVAVCPTCADKGDGNVCEHAGQRCKETSTSVANVKDWLCVCPGEQTGSAAAAVASCHVDECALNNGRLAAVCGAAGQRCTDPNTRVIGGMGDWQCECPAPSLGKATGRVSTCLLDECAAPAVSSVCTAAGQVCEDPNTDSLSRGDWTCVCVGQKELRRGTGMPANCLLPPMSWCAMHGEQCTSLGQACVPDAANIMLEGSCECIAPQTGPSKKGGATVCELDECEATCGTCANQGAGSLCTLAGQTCVEGSKNPVTGMSDWRCKCAGSDTYARAAAAVCTLNECGTDAAKVCVAAEQTCEDPNIAPDSLDDWFCTCHAPAVGRKVAGAAACTFDECVLHEPTCTAAGQLCRDHDLSANVQGDWTCDCMAPATGSAVGKAASCVYKGECVDAAKADVCTAAGQTCVDPNPAVDGDWQCRCVAPQMGLVGAQAAAVCTLDECRAACASCATLPGSMTHTCAVAGQTCEDPNTAVHSLRDWVCACSAPAVGQQVAAVAVCRDDECASATNRHICEAVRDTAGAKVQHCVDPDNTVRGDWVCECMYPYTGTAGRSEPAVCVVDECAAPASWAPGGLNGDAVCAAAGQTCLDPQQGVASQLGNWLCQCAGGVGLGAGGSGAGAGGATGAGAPAMGRASTDCERQTLCATHADACGAGQMCVEEDATWHCRCLAPLTGAQTKEGRAACVLDECEVRCETCAQSGSVHTCTSAGQKCVDHDTSPTSLSDWSCLCTVGTGEGLVHAAACVVDECDLNGVTCLAKGQTCVDHDTRASALGDWVCRCVAPASGEAVAAQATCLLDECVQYGARCAAAGQICIDHSTAPASLNDWTCNCPAPSKGVMYAGVATCTYEGGCAKDALREVCTSAGQQCVPGAPDAGADSFKCACLPPFRGLPVESAAASCVIDECNDICPTCARASASESNVCTAAGQQCADPNDSALSLNDWACLCAPPATAVAIGRAVESCLVDECVAVTTAGARKCDHFYRFTQDGCECACGWRLDTDGTGPGVSEPCTTGCCNPTRDTKGDWCVVADSAFNKQRSQCNAAINMQQTCAGPRSPLPAGAPVPVHTDVCAEAGQHCVDPNTSPSMRGDWECRCITSSEKHVAHPAICCMFFCLFCVFVFLYFVFYIICFYYKHVLLFRQDVLDLYCIIVIIVKNHTYSQQLSTSARQ